MYSSPKSHNSCHASPCSRRTLTKLDLSYTRIGDIGAKALCDALQGNSVLRTLDLANTKADKVGSKGEHPGLQWPAPVCLHRHKFMLPMCAAVQLDVKVVGTLLLGSLHGSLHGLVRPTCVLCLSLICCLHRAGSS
jgi:hypothetical protein